MARPNFRRRTYAKKFAIAIDPDEFQANEEGRLEISFKKAGRNDYYICVDGLDDEGYIFEGDFDTCKKVYQKLGERISSQELKKIGFKSWNSY
jgi:hypothetical protein